jgi:tetratricopeptide (TPR) repeat protein
MTVQRSAVVRIERNVSPLQKYRAQAASLAPDDVAGWRELGRWASTQGLTKQAREAFTKVKAVAPDDPEANHALGLVLLDGHWVTEKESFAARGFVQFEGEWMAPAERQAILEERQAVEEADQQALDAEIEAYQAEKAEQEAREDAERDIWSGPLDNLSNDWGGGYGPLVWPEEPVIIR